MRVTLYERVYEYRVGCMYDSLYNTKSSIQKLEISFCRGERDGSKNLDGPLDIIRITAINNLSINNREY